MPCAAMAHSPKYQYSPGIIYGLLDQMSPFPGQNLVIIMDNCRIHKCEDVLERILERSVHNITNNNVACLLVCCKGNEIWIPSPLLPRLQPHWAWIFCHQSTFVETWSHFPCSYRVSRQQGRSSHLTAWSCFLRHKQGRQGMVSSLWVYVDAVNTMRNCACIYSKRDRI